MISKKFVVVSFFVLLTISSLFCQPEFTNSKEVYNYWVKRGIIEMTYAFMLDYKDAIGNSDIKENESEGIKFYENKLIDKIDRLQIDSIYNSISELLNNNNWKATNINLFKPLDSRLKNGFELNEEFFNTSKPGSSDKSIAIPKHINKMVNWNSTRNRLLDGYKKSLHALPPNSIIKIDTTKTKTEIIITKTITTKTPSTTTITKTITIKQKLNILPSILWLVIYLLFTFFIGVITGYAISYIKKIPKFSYPQKGQWRHSRWKIFVYNFRMKFNKSNPKPTLSKDKVVGGKGEKEKIFEPPKEEDKTIIENLKPEENIFPFEEPLEKKTAPTEEQKPLALEKGFEELTNEDSRIYFSIPEIDGRFVVENGEAINDGRKFFVVEKTNIPNKGKLMFLSSNKDKQAINQFDYYLKPVCDIENISQVNRASGIEMIMNEDCFVTLIDNRYWLIDPNNKLKIKFV